MFKYVKYDTVQGKYSLIQFIAGDNQVHYFTGAVGNIVSIEADTAKEIYDLIISQPQEINSTEITLSKFRTAVKNSDQINRIRERVREKIKTKYPDYGSEVKMIKLHKINRKRVMYDKFIRECIAFGDELKAGVGYKK